MCFRPLTGIFVFNEIAVKVQKVVAAVGFRPLTGIFVFNCMSRTQSGTVTVSVPLRGFLFLTPADYVKVSKKEWDMFPSPYGDFCF